MRLVLVLIACLAAAPAIAQDRLTLILDWFVNPNHGPIVIAEELGYFTDAGLEVEVIAPADPSDPPKMVAAGRTDLGISYQSSCICRWSRPAAQARRHAGRDPAQLPLG